MAGRFGANGAQHSRAEHRPVCQAGYLHGYCGRSPWRWNGARSPAYHAEPGVGQRCSRVAGRHKNHPVCTRRCPASRAAANEQDQGGSGAPAPSLPVTFRDEPRRLGATTHAAPDAAGIALSRPKSIGRPGGGHYSSRCGVGGRLGQRARWRPYRVLSCGISRTTSAGSLSSRRPWNRGWRSSPSVVHSLKPTSATSRGWTQCTPDRGSLPRSNGRRVPLQGGQRRVQAVQGLPAEAGADFAGVDELVLGIVVAQQQRAEPGAGPARVGEAADDEFLAGFALELQPVPGPAAAVGRVGALGDDPLPAAGARLAEIGLAVGVLMLGEASGPVKVSRSRRICLRSRSGSGRTSRPSAHSMSKM